MTITPLDAHRQANATSPDLAAVLETIAERGVEFVYFQAVTITGRVVGKVAPAKHFERLAVRGVQQHQTAVANLQGTREGVLLAGGVNAPEYTAIPDLETFAVLPWDTSFARVFCRLYEPDHLAERAGAEFACDSRGLLRRLHAGFTDRTGLELRTGCEPEMTWQGEGLEAQFRPGSSPAYHIEHLERNRPIVKKVVEYAQALGLDMIEGDYEDEFQVELNFMYDRADLTADRLTTYRQICKQVARELGIQASFMPKPATGMMGNGCHHNFSLWRDGVNVLAEPGVTELHLSELGQHALGGLLAHSAGAMLINGSTVNSYKRYWDAGQFAPSRINWGLDNKTCTVRLSAVGRLEYKLPDAAVNPYLSHAVILAACEDGMKNEIDPGAPTQGSSYDAPVDTRFPALPLTLGEAIEAFRADEVLTQALGPDLSSLLIDFHADEWARFCGYVTDWEREMYWSDAP
ncbi:glutamine synthetase family protein [Mycolicibacterium smegmatis]|uniref:Glutamine synthetase, catalytic domain, putative n=4 Tax=Mycolicibacterium smegmatis TaxID=1772 RepID=I7GGM5_MYCS2|nr:glutamine synthetase family protein [Mycolicibacterium smegmatis]ABK75399.1 glutamine synthetase III [Mycolicibacterium smegmatis MC2 155]AFP42939.1 Glutamine synthetase, catalytic domain, putative [Mycolicibacterium smegmatis MC2 155]AIU11662.1 glutamine synthetase [Mycolicibacterium smegmatis MC2 155]AIU18287.1 glutamine synthetase [Mycolicibacterium smegmatis]AIU24909.1 glutamine synthetase [Mycolicibacterium smegmatis]